MEGGFAYAEVKAGRDAAVKAGKDAAGEGRRRRAVVLEGDLLGLS